MCVRDKYRRASEEPAGAGGERSGAPERRRRSEAGRRAGALTQWLAPQLSRGCPTPAPPAPASPPQSRAAPVTWWSSRATLLHVLDSVCAGLSQALWHSAVERLSRPPRASPPPPPTRGWSRGSVCLHLQLEATFSLPDGGPHA